ncbi:potassium-transporting ATPase subunit KdpC [Sporomusa acidovorans]|uniref:Potassium-transporting ATPase KdpC subunit n=1 Tax=Sporomusa acidovorans (strain ATCC 49682 / DSM 3132 / Mol) TaxID=1123286 RepID=A0ABZ3IWT6_SPOA4|nr:potassium-transporting ATPase subunit KdpC [Sporomusa acidovorans]OZC23394.1 potassium-transporting ATPase C chain [Sporomusa acidovorans DSM 3132]SDE44224.1 K+-transporting ATPase ATPase C chain [Sporomusa acidovorans]
MWRQIVNSFRMLLVLTVITGFVYPLTMVGVANTIFPSQAKGSLVERQGQVVGSKLIGQNFTQPGYFHGRPSAAGKDSYDAAGSAGSNLGPTNKKLIDTVADNVNKARQENGLSESAAIPADLVTASASGLDPDISPEAAYLQVERVAEARGLAAKEVANLVDKRILNRQLALFGEPRVNVLELNMALDRLK